MSGEQLARTALSRLTDLKARLEARLTSVETDVETLSATTYKAARTTGTTDGSGDLVVTHGFGSTPTGVVHSPESPAVTTQLRARTSTTFTVRFYDAAGAAVTSTAVAVHWTAFG